jgi:drug/metabolite transporter (DMT)-like permease
LADILLLLTATFWGVNFSVVKVVLVYIPPLAFTSLRFVLATALMFLIAWGMGVHFQFHRPHLIYMAVLGLVGNTAYQVSFVFGVDHTSADNAALILATVPAWVALIGTIAGVERVRTKGWLGVGLSLAGILLIMAGGDHDAEFQFGGASLQGDSLILVATLCWTGYTLLSRPMFRYYPPLAVTSFSTLMGTIPLLILAAPSIAQIQWLTVPWFAWAGLAFSGVFAIALAYIFWNFGVSQLGSARTSLYSNLTPPIALFTAWLLLAETLTLLQWLGALLALGGVVLARRFAGPRKT